jgi:hypothetical protein
LTPHLVFLRPYFVSPRKTFLPLKGGGEGIPDVFKLGREKLFYHFTLAKGAVAA